MNHKVTIEICENFLVYVFTFISKDFEIRDKVRCWKHSGRCHRFLPLHRRQALPRLSRHRRQVNPIRTMMKENTIKMAKE